jgi:hypothetical protein
MIAEEWGGAKGRRRRKRLGRDRPDRARSLLRPRRRRQGERRIPLPSASAAGDINTQRQDFLQPSKNAKATSNRPRYLLPLQSNFPHAPAQSGTRGAKSGRRTVEWTARPSTARSTRDQVTRVSRAGCAPKRDASLMRHMAMPRVQP